MFKVCARQCPTCIYKTSNPLDLNELEDAVRDRDGGFRNYRACHHHHLTNYVCCRGFWDRHKHDFSLGRIAQRLGAVQEM